MRLCYTVNFGNGKEKVSDFHNSLLLEAGVKFTLVPIINLILMCMGLGSPGTIAEVLRGYIGDNRSENLFTHSDDSPNLIYNLFSFISNSDTLRPFELATLRLMNMVEVIKNWNTYMNEGEFLTQRSATFLVDSNYNILYSYYSKALLDYSENMSKPLDFLEISKEF